MFVFFPRMKLRKYMPNIDCHIQIEADNITTWQPWCVQVGTDGKDFNVHDLLVLTSLDN